MAVNPRLHGVDRTPGILARGPWPGDVVQAHWHDEPFEPAPDKVRAADDAIRALRERGAPSHDGGAAGVAGYRETIGGLVVHLHPTRWSLRLVDGDSSDSIAALCV